MHLKKNGGFDWAKQDKLGIGIGQIDRERAMCQVTLCAEQQIRLVHHHLYLLCQHESNTKRNKMRRSKRRTKRE